MVKSLIPAWDINSNWGCVRKNIWCKNSAKIKRAALWWPLVALFTLLWKRSDPKKNLKPASHIRWILGSSYLTNLVILQLDFRILLNFRGLFLKAVIQSKVWLLIIVLQLWWSWRPNLVNVLRRAALWGRSACRHLSRACSQDSPVTLPDMGKKVTVRRVLWALFLHLTETNVYQVCLH